MQRLLGLVLAGGIVLGHAAVANAQFGLRLGNPYTGTSLSIGSGYGVFGGYGYPGYGGYGYGYPGYRYSSFYSAPLVGATTYSSGYAGYAAPAYVAPAPVVATTYPVYSYRSFYGYAPYARGIGYGYGGLRGRGYGWGGRGWRGRW